jgi:hypothetical protein
VTLGVLRMARQFERADQFVQTHEPNVPADWRVAWDNEVAALAWHRGEHEPAAAAWNKQPESVPIWFNRGMAALFLGRVAEARVWLTRAADLLPESSSWHHLARLYLTVADMRE